MVVSAYIVLTRGCFNREDLAISRTSADLECSVLLLLESESYELCADKEEQSDKDLLYVLAQQSKL